jgi:hypothetical protein
MTPVSIEQLRATLQQKSTRTQKAARDKTGWQSQIYWCKLKVVTNKHEDCNLVFTNHGKENGIYPLRTNLKKEIAKAQNKDQRSIVKTCKNTSKRICVINLLRT